MIDNYRIKRTDSRNIAIQRRMETKDSEERWLTISYHGNSLNSLISGLFELIMAQHTPEQRNLYQSLVELQLELVSGLTKVEKMIDEAKLSDK